MRILPDYDCIYIHVPKTAGNSISEALDNLPHGPAYDLPERVHPNKHIKARELRAVTDPEVWDSAFKFAFVRNPWDQMVSSYHWWVQTAGRLGAVQESEEVAAMGFEGFMASPYGAEQINEFRGNSFDWIADEDGNVLLDYVGKFETLQDSWDIICARIGTPPARLPHLNRTDRTHYRDYYTDETREQVARRFARTIEAFGYSF